MADVAELLLLLRGDSAGAKHAISDVKGGLSGLEGSASHAGGVFRTLGHLIEGALSIAASGLAVAVASGIKAYSDIEDGQSKLNAAMKSAGPAYTQNQAGIDKTTTALMKLGVSTSDSLTGMAKLTEAHVPLAQQEGVLTAAANLNAASGMGLAASLQAILMGAQGTGRGLKQYGINLPPIVATTLALNNATAKAATDQAALLAAEKKYGDNSKEAIKARAALTTAQEKLNTVTASYNDKMKNMPALVDQVNQRLGGQAVAKTQTFSGALNQLQIGWQKVAYSVGQKVVPYLDQFAQWLTAHEPQIAAFVVTVLGGLGTALTDMGKGIGFIVDHKTVFIALAATIAGAFVVGHAASWATDAISKIGSVISAAKKAPGVIGKILGFVSGSSGSTATKAVTGVEDAAGQRVFVTNMPPGGVGGGGGGNLLGDLGKTGGGAGTMAGLSSSLFSTGATAGTAMGPGLLALLVSGPTIMSGIQVAQKASLTDVQKLQGAYGLSAKNAQAVADFLENASPQLKTQFQSMVDSAGGGGAAMVTVMKELQQAAKDVTNINSAFGNAALAAYGLASGISGISNQIGGMVSSFASAAGRVNAAASNLGRQASGSIHHAAGGTIPAHGWGIVGEHGPELRHAGSIPIGIMPTERVLGMFARSPGMAGALGGGGATRQGGDHIEVNVTNPHSTVDVTQAIDQSRWLALMRRRGAMPSAWPTPA